MRKSNKVLFRTVSALLCSVLVTTSVLSTTFAKYTSGGTDSVSARVADGKVTLLDDPAVDNTFSGLVSPSGVNNLAVMVPGSSGTFTQFRLSGNPEVRNRLDLDVSIDFPEDKVLGYADLVNDTDYFPILITVSRINGTDVADAYFYMNMPNPADTSTKVTTVQGIFDAIEYAANNYSEAPFEDYIAPLAWSNSLVTYSVNWTWYYNDDEIDAASIPTYVKTELKNHQSPEKDTILGAAILNRNDLDDKSSIIEDLSAAVNAARNATDKKAAIANLSDKLAAVLGNEPQTYLYEKQESYPINWRGLRNSSYMTCYDSGYAIGATTPKITSFGSYFTVSTGADYMLSTEIIADKNKAYLELCYRTVPERNSSGTIIGEGATIQPKPGEKYEYTFSARNITDTGYAGVVFAIDPNDIPYFFFGIFYNNSNDSHATMSLSKKSFPANSSSANIVGSCYGETFVVGQSKSSATGTAAWYGNYKVTYEGLDNGKMRVKCYYQNNSGTYVQLGNTLDLAAGSRISVGVESRTGVNANRRSVTIVNAKILQTKVVSNEETVLQNLLNRAEDIVTTAQSNQFNFSVSSDVTVAQVQS